MNLSLVFDIAAILVGGFFAAHLASRFHIPKVTAYLLWGLMLGPLSGKLLAFLTGGAITEPIINSHELEALHVINELALGLILFGMGGELTSKRLRSLTGEIIKISCITSLLVYVAVGLGTYCAGIFLPGTSLPLSAAALMGAMAISTAPAATVLVINEYRASGRLTDVILGLTAVNVVLCLLAYKLSYAFILWHGAGDLSIAALIPHLGSVIWYLGGSVVVGVGIGLLMSLLEQNRDEGSDELYIAYFACVILGIGICKFLGVTYLLALMVSGMVVLHSFFEGEEVFKRLKEVGKPLYLMFFVLSGAELQPDVLVLMGWVGVAYVVFRSIALWVGFYFSARWQGENKEVWKFGGTALLCHASLPLGLYMTLNQQDPHLALPIGTIVLSSVVVFELAGPILERWSLIQAGEIPVESIVHHQEKTLYRMGLIETVNYLMESLLHKPHVSNIDSLKVSDVMNKRFRPLKANSTLKDVINIFQSDRKNIQAVLDDRGKLNGIIYYGDISHLSYYPSMNELIIARDVMRKTWDSITPSVSLSDAITQLHQSKEQSIVVVDPEDDLKILGFLEELDAVTAERRSGRRNH